MAGSRVRRLSAMASSMPWEVSGWAESLMSPASPSSTDSRSSCPAASASLSKPCTSSRSVRSKARARSWSIRLSSWSVAVRSVAVRSVAVRWVAVHGALFPGAGRAAHHPQHSYPAGADESHDQGAREHQEDDVKPGGVVPRHALVGNPGPSRIRDQAETAEDQLDDVPGRHHRGVERAEQEHGHPGHVILPVDIQDRGEEEIGGDGGEQGGTTGEAR